MMALTIVLAADDLSPNRFSIHPFYQGYQRPLNSDVYSSNRNQFHDRDFDIDSSYNFLDGPNHEDSQHQQNQKMNDKKDDGYGQQPVTSYSGSPPSYNYDRKPAHPPAKQKEKDHGLLKGNNDPKHILWEIMKIYMGSKKEYGQDLIDWAKFKMRLALTDAFTNSGQKIKHQDTAVETFYKIRMMAWGVTILGVVTAAGILLAPLLVVEGRGSRSLLDGMPNMEDMSQLAANVLRAVQQFQQQQP